VLMSLISLSDDEIETVTSALRQWCQFNHCDIDSIPGRRAITVAVELVQTKHDHVLLERLIEALGPLPSTTLSDNSFLAECQIAVQSTI